MNSGRPLTLMLGPLEESLAAAEQLLPRERERVRVVHRNGMRLLKLVNIRCSIFLSNRGRAGARANFEPTDLAALTAELASNFGSATMKAGLTLQIDCPGPSPIRCTSIGNMWEKIVLNLLSNAFKFTFEGWNKGMGAAKRRGRGIGRTRHRYRYPRRKSCRGYSSDSIESRCARGRSFEGSGIGLALVKELVGIHGGSIRVESTESRGTTFHVSVPLGSAHLPRGQVRGERALTSTAVTAQAFVE